MRLLVLIFLLLISTGLKAQVLGLKGGMGWHSLGGSLAGQSEGLNLAGSYFGWKLGFFVQTGNKRVFLEPGLNISQRGFNQKAQLLFIDFEANYRMTYLELPLNLHVQLLPSRRQEVTALNFSAGPIVSLLLSARGHQNQTLIILLDQSSFDTEQLGFNNFEFGWNTEVQFLFAKNISIGAQYQRAFTRVLNTELSAATDPFDTIFGNSREKNYVNWKIGLFLTYTLPKSLFDID